MEHSYFFRELVWNAQGTYYDGEQNRFPLSGRVTLVRRPGKWTLDGFLDVAFPQPARFENAYTIAQGAQSSTLEWESYNPALGTLRGSFEIVGDCIISRYRSPDGVYEGTETLLQTSETSYYNVGVTFCNGKKMSSWVANLQAETE